MASRAETAMDPVHERLGLSVGLRYRVGRFVLIGIPLAILVIWTTLPILWAVLSSLKESLEIYESNTLLPANPNLDGYRTVLSMRGFDSWLVNSFRRVEPPILRAGRYAYALRRAGEGLKIARKTVYVLDDRIVGPIDIFNI